MGWFAKLLDVSKLYLYKNEINALNMLRCCYIARAVERADGKVIVTYFRDDSYWTLIVVYIVDGCGYMGGRQPWLRYHAIIFSIRSDTQSSISFMRASSFPWTAWPSIRSLFLWNARLHLMKLLRKKATQRQCVEAMATVLLSKVGVVVKLFDFFAIAGRASLSG